MSTCIPKKDSDGPEGAVHALPVAGRADDIDPVAIGGRLKERMQAVGIDQAELARRAGVKHNSLSRLLNGKNEPRLSVLWPVAYALGLTIDQTLGFAPPPPPLLRKRDRQVVAAYYADKTLQKTVDRMIPPEEPT